MIIDLGEGVRAKELECCDKIMRAGVGENGRWTVHSSYAAVVLFV